MKNRNLVLKYQAIMKKLNKTAILFFMLVMPGILFSQTKEQLKEQKTLIEKEIYKTNKLLKKTKKNKNISLSYLNALEIQINNQSQLLGTLKFEIQLISKQIKKTENKIIEIENIILNEDKRMQDLKEEYAKMIYAAFIKKGNSSDLMFIISSQDFNQAYKRVSYLKQYTSFRKSQVRMIKKIQLDLKSKKEEVIFQQQQLFVDSELKTELVLSKKNEINSINNSKSEKEDLINKLSKSEEVFKDQLQDQKRRAKELEDKIRKIIEEEIRKAREKTKNKKGEESYSLTPESKALSSKFESNKGRLPWPLEKGVIVQVYGKSKHPVFSSVEIINNGINIATNPNTIVRSVFDGIVSRIFFIKGAGKAILINHGEYFSVYSGLKDISVKVGEKILSKEKIGVVVSQELDLKTELHFEIWKGYEKQDPSKWLFNGY